MATIQSPTPSAGAATAESSATSAPCIESSVTEVAPADAPHHVTKDPDDALVTAPVEAEPGHLARVMEAAVIVRTAVRRLLSGGDAQIDMKSEVEAGLVALDFPQVDRLLTRIRNEALVDRDLGTLMERSGAVEAEEVGALVGAELQRLLSPEDLGRFRVLISQRCTELVLAGITGGMYTTPSKTQHLFSTSPHTPVSCLQGMVIAGRCALANWREKNANETPKRLAAPTLFINAVVLGALAEGVATQDVVGALAVCWGVDVTSIHVFGTEDGGGAAAMSLDDACTKSMLDARQESDVVFVCGSGGLGRAGMVDAVRAWCQSRGAWLHVEGPLPAVSKEHQTNCDSFTVDLSSKHASVACLVCNSHIGPASMRSLAPLQPAASMTMAVHLETASQKMGNRVRQFAETTKEFADHVASMGEMVQRYENNNPYSVIIRFLPDGLPTTVEASNFADAATQRLLIRCVTIAGPVFDQVMTMKINGHLYLRISGMDNEESTVGVATLFAVLQQEMLGMQAIMKNAPLFAEMAKARGFVNHQCGRFDLGAISFIPIIMRGKTEKQEWLHKLNRMLATRLREKFAFVTLKADRGAEAVLVFGAPPSFVDEAFVTELLDETQRIAREVEESPEFVEMVSSVITSGIAEAKQKIDAEHKQTAAEEGIMRAIPLISSAWNYFAPPPQKRPSGVSFHLESGAVEVTHIARADAGDGAGADARSSSSRRTSADAAGDDEDEDASGTASTAAAETNASSPASEKRDTTGLPAGWERRFDSRTNQNYYVNHIAKTTQWEHPSTNTLGA